MAPVSDPFVARVGYPQGSDPERVYSEETHCRPGKCFRPVFQAPGTLVMFSGEDVPPYHRAGIRGVQRIALKHSLRGFLAVSGVGKLPTIM